MIAKSKDTVDQAKLDSMYAVGQGFASKISRGISFYFSWLDAEAEPELAGVLDSPDEPGVFPRLVILNPGKRKRFLAHTGEINERAIEGILDKILAGDAKFKAVKGNKLPELVSAYP